MPVLTPCPTVTVCTLHCKVQDRGVWKRPPGAQPWPIGPTSPSSRRVATCVSLSLAGPCTPSGERGIRGRAHERNSPTEMVLSPDEAPAPRPHEHYKSPPDYRAPPERYAHQASDACREAKPAGWS